MKLFESYFKRKEDEKRIKDFIYKKYINNQFITSNDIINFFENELHIYYCTGEISKLKIFLYDYLFGLGYDKKIFSDGSCVYYIVNNVTLGNNI